MGCLELFLSEVSSGVLAPLEDGLALRPVQRLFLHFLLLLFHFSCSLTPFSLSGSHFLSFSFSLCHERENERAIVWHQKEASECLCFLPAPAFASEL